MKAIISSVSALALVLAISGCNKEAATGAEDTAATGEPAPVWEAVPIPEQAAVAYEGYADIPDVKLWYWDTGGEGEAIVLLHPWSQSSLIWKYQQPVFAKAGYRVIAPSRRGAYKSLPGPDDNPGSASGDILALVDSLGLDKIHLVGCAAGGVTATAFAISHQERVKSLTLCNSILLPAEKEWEDMFSRLQLNGLAGSGGPPHEWRELGANYRAGNPEGMKAWAELHDQATPNGIYNKQSWGDPVTWETMGKMEVPVLLLTGDTDLFAPPAMQRLFAQKFPNAQTHVVDEAGHATYWEQPAEFNRVVLDWIGKHKVAD
jgi:pimeloyl-ACP methyl ester carboxylesterase